MLAVPFLILAHCTAPHHAQCLPPLIVQATLSIASAVIAEASFSCLRLGQQPPLPSLGSMLNTAKNYMDNASWMAVWPGASIFLLVLSFNLRGWPARCAGPPTKMSRQPCFLLMP
jgi:peptide/nickel transport system permease protein